MNDEARRVKPEGMTKSETRNARIEVLIIRASDFIRHSAFGIRHLFS